MGDEVPSEVNTNEVTEEDSRDQAQLLLRAKNIKEFHSVLTTAGSLTFPNGVAIESGVVVAFKNKGLYDGNWIIQKVSIRLTEGKLQVEIDWRKCLSFPSGYNVKTVTQPPQNGGGD